MVINPGSTSTKIAVYHDLTEMFVRTVRHTAECLALYPRIIDQFEMRKQCVIDALRGAEIPMQFDAVVARGGLLKPMSGGVYEVNEAMLNDILHPVRNHACNLGCLIAHELAATMPGCRAFIADPGMVDEVDDVARITGYPGLDLIPFWHALNQRATARHYAADLTAEQPEQLVAYEDLDLIVCHLGGGITVAVHHKGRAIDVPNALDGSGPFSAERAGTLPTGQFIDLCYSGQLTKEELKQRIQGHAGLVAHLGTNDVRAIERMISEGNKRARLVLDAMIYQVAKAIGGGATVLYGRVDAILITGGMAYSHYVTGRLRKRVEFIAPVVIYPGENEMEALAANARDALLGRQEIQVYQ